MLAAHALLPEIAIDVPPFVLVHGAANSARVWTHWQQELAARGVASYALELRGHGESPAMDLSGTSMRDYADDVRALVRQLAVAPVLAGWSMGGLAAMLAATDGGVAACVGLAPSTPARVRDASMELRTGEFGPEEYGITTHNPDEQPAMPDLDREERAIALASLSRESRYARDERAAGVVVGSLPCPLLIVTGTGDALWPRSRYGGLHLDAQHVSVDGASHWGLVLNRRVLRTLVPEVVAWALDAAHADAR
ncbi:MAG: alpha/beta hydrolase [Dehalococcoidia bacterium]